MLWRPEKNLLNGAGLTQNALIYWAYRIGKGGLSAINEQLKRMYKPLLP